MKKICLLSVVVITTAILSIFAAPINTYQELKSAMLSGNRFVILLDLEQCLEIPGMPLGYLTPTAMMLMPSTDTIPEYIVTSLLHFSDHSGNPTYEYVKFFFNSDNSVIVRTLFYDPQNFSPRGTAHTIKCIMGKQIKAYSDALIDP